MDFVYNSFIKFKGENMHFAFLFIAIIYIIVMGRRKEKIIFLPNLVVLLLTVFNFLFIEEVMTMFEVADVYYRFFWCIQLIIIVAYFFTVLIFKSKNNLKRLLVLFLLSIMIMLSGAPVLTKSDWAQNIYKVPDALLSISDFIIRDSPIDNPTVAFEYHLNIYARQYNPAIHLSLNRNYIIDVLGISNVGITDNIRELEDFRQQEVLIRALMKGEETDAKVLQDALLYTNTMYIVFSNNETLAAMLTNAGCTPVAIVDEYYIYRNNILYHSH